jgi:small subunit ribosomal protein S2
MKDLLEAGVHFGHQTRRWNPKMKKYIFGSRNGIHIIDLQKTLKLFRDIATEIINLAAEGSDFLFVGTKRQAQEIIETEAKRCGVYFVNHRWPGGMLTNFKTIKNSVNRLDYLEKILDSNGSSPEAASLTKKELIGLKREYEKLEKILKGIRAMKNLPGAMIVVDISKEHIAVKEARKLGIPVFAVVDTNCDPDDVDYIIPGNDDAIRAINLFVTKFSDCILEGHEIYKKKKEDEESQEELQRMEEAKIKEAASEEDLEQRAELLEELSEEAEFDTLEDKSLFTEEDKSDSGESTEASGNDSGSEDIESSSLEPDEDK